MKPATPAAVIAHPKEILDSAIRAAIEPLREELRAAVAEDRALFRAVESVSPPAVKEAANEIFDRAVAGDAESLAAIEAAGGISAWAQHRGAAFGVREARRAGAAQAIAPLFQKLVESLDEALPRAKAQIEAEWAAVCEAHGEPATRSIWADHIDRCLRSVQNMPAQARIGVGAAWLIEAAGLLPMLD